MEDLADWLFDEQLPEHLQLQSSRHFTPVSIARQAAHLLAPYGGVSVLDVGAGAGKFCLTAASEIKDATFVGVEVRPHLVEVANAIARRNELTNARFVCSNAFDLDWSCYDAFYLFNPFAEHLFAGALALDNAIELDRATYTEYVEAVVERLSLAPIGTRVVSYHGFGAPPPSGYELAEESLGSCLELWIKTHLGTALEVEGVAA